MDVNPKIKSKITFNYILFFAMKPYPRGPTSKFGSAGGGGGLVRNRRKGPVPRNISSTRGTISSLAEKIFLSLSFSFSDHVRESIFVLLHGQTFKFKLKKVLRKKYMSLNSKG